MTNEYGENLKGKCTEMEACGIREMSRKERYQLFKKEVEDAKQNLRTANVPVSVNEALEQLNKLMENAVKDMQLEEVRGWTADIAGSIIAVKLHDYTRSELGVMLKKMLDCVEEIIAEETKKERVEMLRRFFISCAENAEAIAEIVDIDSIIG